MNPLRKLWSWWVDPPTSRSCYHCNASMWGRSFTPGGRKCLGCGQHYTEQEFNGLSRQRLKLGL